MFILNAIFFTGNYFYFYFLEAFYTPLAFDIHKESFFAFAQNTPTPLSGDTAVCISISMSLYACTKALRCVISKAASLGNL